MAEWNKNKVEPSAINKGNEFTIKDNLAIDELNAIVNNSFYSVETAEKAREMAESAFTANGTLVSVNGKFQSQWSADFAENERLKSKNLLYMYNSDISLEGVDFVVNENNQTIYMNGVGTGINESHICKIKPITLKAGTYYSMSAKIVSGTANLMYIYAYNFEEGFWGRTLGGEIIDHIHTMMFETDLTIEGLRIYTDTYVSLDNCVIQLQIEEGNVATEWQYPYGEIVHKDEIENVEHVDVLFDINLQPILNELDYSGSGYGSGITPISLDVSKYSKLRFLISTENQLNSLYNYFYPIEVDLTIPDNSEYKATGMVYNPYYILTTQSSNEYRAVLITVNYDKNSISFLAYSQSHDAVAVEVPNRIVKIEGVY